MNLKSQIKELQEFERTTRKPEECIGYVQLTDGGALLDIQKISFDVANNCYIISAKNMAGNLQKARTIPAGYSEVTEMEESGSSVVLTLECSCQITRHTSWIRQHGVPKKMKCLGKHGG